MEELDDFQQCRRVVEDFVARSLTKLPGDFSRLVHMAALQDPGTGRYRHAGLELFYSESAVDRALHLCHVELLERILETPLAQQEPDLNACLARMDVSADRIAAVWKENEFYRLLVPGGVPVYLRELFCSNLGILLQLASPSNPGPQPSA